MKAFRAVAKQMGLHLGLLEQSEQIYYNQRNRFLQRVMVRQGQRRYDELNALQKTEGESWTIVRVQALREHLGIARFDPIILRPETSSVDETAHRLTISVGSVLRHISAGKYRHNKSCCPHLGKFHSKRSSQAK